MFVEIKLIKKKKEKKIFLESQILRRIMTLPSWFVLLVFLVCLINEKVNDLHIIQSKFSSILKS